MTHYVGDSCTPPHAEQMEMFGVLHQDVMTREEFEKMYPTPLDGERVYDEPEYHYTFCEGCGSKVWEQK